MRIVRLGRFDSRALRPRFTQGADNASRFPVGRVSGLLRSAAGWKPAIQQAGSLRYVRSGPRRSETLGLGTFLFALVNHVWAGAMPQLRPPVTFIGPTFWERHELAIMLSVTALVIALGLLVAWLRRPRPVVVTPIEVLTRQALEACRQRDEDYTLASEVSRILQNYFLGVFSMPPQELTSEEWRAVLLNQPLATPDLATETAQFLQDCDAFKFAPGRPRGPVGLVDRATKIVGDFEAKRPRPAVQAQPQPTAASVG